jgi:hypothetical protein
MDVDLDIIAGIQTLKDVYSFEEPEHVDVSDWDSLGEAHHGTFPFYYITGVDAVGENANPESTPMKILHGVSQIFVNQRLFQEKVHLHGIQIAMAYYMDGKITTLRFNSPQRDVVLDLKQI